MKKTFLSITFFFFFTCLSAQYAPDRILVKLKDQARISDPIELAEMKRLNGKFPIKEIHALSNNRINGAFVIQLKEQSPIDSVIDTYRNSGVFGHVEPDFIGYGGGRMAGPGDFPNDAFFQRQWGLVNDGSFSLGNVKTDSDIDMELAWDIETGSSDIIVAILDSGTKLDHPEIMNRLWINEDESVDQKDSDQNGFVDDRHGYDFVNNDPDPADDHGHGSNVSGIVAAEANNEIGYAGVDQHCRMMTGKILNDENSGFYSWWIEAIYYAVDNGAKVINMSVGGSSFSVLMQDAVNYAHARGVTIVACMMNQNTGSPYYPAGYQNTIAVGSTNPDDQRTEPFFWDENSGSNFGQHIDLVAPGNYIYGLRFNSNTNFSTYWGGTSQAAPLVTGVVSLLLAQNPDRTPDEIRDILTATAEDRVGDEQDVAGFDIYYGYGRLNAHAALSHQISSVRHAPDRLKFDFYPNPVRIGEEITISGIHGNLVMIRAYNLDGRLLSAIQKEVNDGVLHLEMKDTGQAAFLHIRQQDGREGMIRIHIVD